MNHHTGLGPDKLQDRNMTIIADESTIHILCDGCNRRETIHQDRITGNLDKIDFAIDSLAKKGWLDCQHTIYCPDCVKCERKSASATEITIQYSGVWIAHSGSQDELIDKLVMEWDRKTFIRGEEKND